MDRQTVRELRPRAAAAQHIEIIPIAGGLSSPHTETDLPGILKSNFASICNEIAVVLLHLTSLFQPSNATKSPGGGPSLPPALFAPDCCLNRCAVGHRIST